MEDQVPWTLIKWAVPPVIGGLCTAIVVLWFKLAEKSKEYAKIYRQLEDEKDRIQREWREDVKRMSSEHREEQKGYLEKYISLLVQVKSTLDHILGRPPEIQE